MNGNLTDKQVTVKRMLDAGDGIATISRRLGISETCVRYYKKAIDSKSEITSNYAPWHVEFPSAALKSMLEAFGSVVMAANEAGLAEWVETNVTEREFKRTPKIGQVCVERMRTILGRQNRKFKTPRVDDGLKDGETFTVEQVRDMIKQAQQEERSRCLRLVREKDGVENIAAAIQSGENA